MIRVIDQRETWETGLEKLQRRKKEERAKTATPRSKIAQEA